MAKKKKVFTHVELPDPLPEAVELVQRSGAVRFADADRHKKAGKLTGTFQVLLPKRSNAGILAWITMWSELLTTDEEDPSEGGILMAVDAIRKTISDVVQGSLDPDTIANGATLVPVVPELRIVNLGDAYGARMTQAFNAVIASGGDVHDFEIVHEKYSELFGKVDGEDEDDDE